MTIQKPRWMQRPEKVEYRAWEDGGAYATNTFSPLACYWVRWWVRAPFRDWYSFGLWWTTDMERFGPPMRPIAKWRWKGRRYAVLLPYFD